MLFIPGWEHVAIFMWMRTEFGGITLWLVPTDGLRAAHKWKDDVWKTISRHLFAQGLIMPQLPMLTVWFVLRA